MNDKPPAEVGSNAGLGIGCETYDDTVARQYTLFRTQRGYFLRLHTIWLPDFVEVVTELSLAYESIGMLSTLLMQATHGPLGLDRVDA